MNEKISEKKFFVYSPPLTLEQLTNRLKEFSCIPPPVQNRAFFCNSTLNKDISQQLTVFHQCVVSCSLRRSVRMSLGICPGVSSKFWRVVGSFKSRYLGAKLKLRSVAFQPCMARGGGICGKNWRNKGFRPKVMPKTRFFWGHKSGSSHFRGAWDPLFQMWSQFRYVLQKVWVKSFQMSYGPVR